MRKKSILLTALSLFVALLASAFVFAGCGGETNPPDGGDSSTGGGSASGGGNDIQNSLTLTRTSVQLVYGETAVVVAKYKDEDGKTLVWQTSNSSVATVDGGVITSVGLGSAVVTATYGSLSATCNVSVSYGAYQPTLKVDHIGDELSLLKNEDYEVNARVLFNGKDYPCELTAVIDDSTVATFEGGKIKALKSGTTSVTIKGVWKGFESPLMEKTISLNVVESDVVMYLNVEKDGVKEVRDEVTLYVTDSFAGNSYTTSAEIELVATENGVSKEGTLSVVEGSKNVTLEDGVVTAKGVGSATVRATYVTGDTTYTKDLIVNVVCPVVPYTEQFILTDEVISSGSYKDYFAEGASLVKVKQGSREIKTYGTRWSGIVYKGAQTEAIEIQTTKGGYLFENVLGYNVLLTTENFASTLKLDSKDITQYYGLNGDIGTPENPVSMNGQRNASDSSAFKGTFDGNGYTVYANVYENGVFGGYGAGAVVKNTKFVLTFNGTKANGLSSDKGRWGRNLNITLENLYIETTNFRKGDHAISEFKDERLKMKDIVVVINNATGLTDYDGSDDAGVLFGVDVCYYTYIQANVGLELFDNVRVVVDKLLPMSSGQYYSNTKFVNFAVNDISAFGNVTRKSTNRENADYCLITAVENHSDWLTDVCYGGNGKTDLYVKGIYFCYGAARLENGGVYRYGTVQAMKDAGVKQVGTWEIA